MHASALPSEASAPWPSAWRGWLAVLLLALASIVSQFDRTVINLMVGPVKQAFALDDTRFGMLQGVAFGIFYVLACIPIGRLADRYQRRLIIAVALASWSVFAMASGLARSYAQLFLTRIGVAVGEASLTPAGFSMLSDLFPPERLGGPMGAFLMSSPVGQGLAFIGGGALLQWLTTSPVLAAGPLAALAPWQAAFVVVGFPGLLLVPLWVLLREPERRRLHGERAEEGPLSTRAVAAVVSERRAALVPMFAGFAFVPLVSYAFAIWTPALFERSYGWNPAQIGLSFGLILLVFGTAGAYFGGYMNDLVARRGYLDAPLRVAAFGFVGCGVFGALAPLMPSAPAALLFLAPAVFLSNMPYACAGTALQLIVPNRARAQVSALYITMTTLIGLGAGPLVVGLMTDHVFSAPEDIRYSLSIVVGVAAPVSFTLLLAACRPYRELRRPTRAREL
ncbi:MAG TPA: MFS transporter [Steroidobacteraceae bacterium]|jgi:MFS family permease|nr:MFS transporter [Steroidobacteraceae bacterium]